MHNSHGIFRSLPSSSPVRLHLHPQFASIFIPSWLPSPSPVRLHLHPQFASIFIPSSPPSSSPVHLHLHPQFASIFIPSSPPSSSPVRQAPLSLLHRSALFHFRASGRSPAAKLNSPTATCWRPRLPSLSAMKSARLSHTRHRSENDKEVHDIFVHYSNNKSPLRFFIIAQAGDLQRLQSSSYGLDPYCPMTEKETRTCSHHMQFHSHSKSLEAECPYLTLRGTPEAVMP